MFLMKAMMVSILLSVALIKSGMSRPSPSNRRNHIMKKTDEMDRINRIDNSHTYF